MRISDLAQAEETPLCVSIQTCGKTACKGMSSRGTDPYDQPQYTDQDLAIQARYLNEPDSAIETSMETDSIGGSFGQDSSGGKTVLNPKQEDVQAHMVAQGIAIGYGLLASVLYGKYKVLDRVLLGLGAVAFGAATYTGLKLGIDAKPSKHPVDYVVGNISGILNGLIAIGAGAAMINPKLVAKTAPEAVKSSIPI